MGAAAALPLAAASFLTGDPGFLVGDLGFLAGDLGFLAGDLGFLAGDLSFLAGDPGFLAGALASLLADGSLAGGPSVVDRRAPSPVFRFPEPRSVLRSRLARGRGLGLPAALVLRAASCAAVSACAWPGSRPSCGTGTPGGVRLFVAEYRLSRGFLAF
ncbi:hypothetical protein Ade02nite_43190 [Paractinoplanes deccanensis]|uniref:Secreted protein n=1 Tax=Paractinoplanes deccanensis TaxID=113561 RepID=A0ABQ3Y6S3_9ACTN|nr:hypothetical protein Ade02nite_43190 [Actinoplanes deccanensis]